MCSYSKLHNIIIYRVELDEIIVSVTPMKTAAYVIGLLKQYSYFRY